MQEEVIHYGDTSSPYLCGQCEKGHLVLKRSQFGVSVGCTKCSYSKGLGAKKIDPIPSWNEHRLDGST